MQKEYLLLEDTIKKICGTKPIYYISNPGNYGDALIRYGTIKFLRDIGIKYVEIKSFSFRKVEWLIPLLRPKGTLIYGGGGAWCNLWNFEFLLKKIENRFDNIIVLPSTYEIIPSMKNKNTTFFCRDKYESMKNVPNGLFCHDMAFYIGNIEVENGVGNGYFFRTDKESTGEIKIPTNNVDISKNGNQYTQIYSFFNELAKYKSIYTDRLHVSIAASLMGKEVHLYPGAYFKNRAIYFSSLENNFKNIIFHQDFKF